VNPNPPGWVNDLEEARRHKGLGHCVRHFASVPSTHAEAMASLDDAAVPDGTLLVADVQTQARGRGGRAWIHLENQLAFSLVLKRALLPKHATRIIFLAADAVIRTLRPMGVALFIKWPNDLMIHTPDDPDLDGRFGPYRKVGGILVEAIVEAMGESVVKTKSHEARVRGMALGMGLNLGSDVVGARIPPRDQVLGKLLDHLEESLAHPEDDGEFSRVLTRLEQVSTTRGAEVVVVDAGGAPLKGVVTGWDENGALCLQSKAGVVNKVHAGDVFFSSPGSKRPDRSGVSGVQVRRGPQLAGGSKISP
jgi:BirA family biotin operon repressor/biotin-[acetyl-CoA-carboxylase] ligase